MDNTFLYKYRKWNINTAKIIRDNELYFSLPKDFNDPFDCRISLKVEANFKQFQDHFLRHKSYFIDAWKRELGDLPQNQIEQEIEDIIRDNHKSAQFQRYISQHHIDQLINCVGVCCFSTRKDNTLMWSHYADSHRGVCLEFLSGGKFFGAALPVRYQPDYPEVSFFSSNQEKLEACILTKSEDWRYEEEQRIVLPGVKGNITYPLELLTGIIMGCQISDKDRNEVIHLTTLLKNPVNLYQAAVREGSFGLNILPI